MITCPESNTTHINCDIECIGNNSCLAMQVTALYGFERTDWDCNNNVGVVCDSAGMTCYEEATYCLLEEVGLDNVMVCNGCGLNTNTPTTLPPTMLPTYSPMPPPTHSPATIAPSLTTTTSLPSQMPTSLIVSSTTANNGGLTSSEEPPETTSLGEVC